jgi:hypothetical protein
VKRWLGLVGVALIMAIAATGAASSIARGDDGGGSGDCSAQSTKSEQWKAEHCKKTDSGGTSSEGATPSGAEAAHAAYVAPNATGEMDCNGWSTKYKSVKQTMMSLCTDPIAVKNGKATRFIDNGWYVGHDEPSVKFISSAHGSGNHMTYYAQLPVDPKAAPTTDGSVTDYAELSVAPWFGLPMCDPKSYPQNPCTPDSDSNKGGLDNPADAGSAFLEVQLYAPGFQPFIDAPSCDATRYCAALTIDSLECNFGFDFCNPACTEPVNFAYIQRNGVPTGPPSPQLANLKTETPNSDTLLMNQGDSIRITIQDTPDGLKVTVDDFTTGQSGFMIASPSNGFMNSDLETCGGTPFAFHPEYDTASQQNQVPWAALEGGVLMETEIGHFETCSSVSNPLATDAGVPFLPFDPNTFQTCNGGMEGSGDTIGEGPCNFVTGNCMGATTEGGGRCPSENFASGNLCEFSDTPCMPAGPRPVSPDVTSGGVSEITWPIAGCTQNFTQNGDLDFDGTGYRPDWPDGTANHPTTFKYAGPFDAEGNPYPSIQFETDAGGSEAFCNTANGEHCAVPPEGASFYPFWSIGNQSTPTGFPSIECLWNFGNDIGGVTTSDFGRTAQYGAPDVARYGGTLTSSVMANPQLSSTCGK